MLSVYKPTKPNSDIPGDKEAEKELEKGRRAESRSMVQAALATFSPALAKAAASTGGARWLCLIDTVGF